MAIVVVAVLLPTVDETPEPLRDAAGTIIYPGISRRRPLRVQVLSLATQLVLWAAIGLVFATISGGCFGADTAGVEYRGVTGIVRLTLLSHGMTDAMADGRFPADEPLNAIGRRQVDAMDEVAGGAAAAFRTRATHPADRETAWSASRNRAAIGRPRLRAVARRGACGPAAG